MAMLNQTNVLRLLIAFILVTGGLAGLLEKSAGRGSARLSPLGANYVCK